MEKKCARESEVSAIRIYFYPWYEVSAGVEPSVGGMSMYGRTHSVSIIFADVDHR